MPAPYPRCLCAGFTIPAKFTEVFAEKVVQAAEQTRSRLVRAKTTFPVFWVVVAALIGTSGPSDTGSPIGDLV